MQPSPILLFLFPSTPTQICVSPLVSGEDCQHGFRHSSYVGAQRLPGAVRQLSEHQWWSVGDTAEHPPGSAGEQHGPQRGTMSDLRLCCTVDTTQRRSLCSSDESSVKMNVALSRFYCYSHTKLSLYSFIYLHLE